MATTPENQRQFIVPTNEITQTIDYNMRFLISENQQNPIAWEVSKIEDTFPSGVIFITLKQDLFNPKTDNKELMIADYYSDPVIPNTNPDIVKRKIEYSGRAEVKVGGGFKIFSYSGKQDIHWSISGLDEDQYQKEEILSSIKIKVIRDYNLIGKTFTLSAVANDTNKVIESVEIGVVSL